eukprot:scaffold21221_cov60-Phaeocystis_antarctica.AAC.12
MNLGGSTYACSAKEAARAITRCAREAARGAVGQALRGRRGDCVLRGRSVHGLLAEHLAAHMEQATWQLSHTVASTPLLCCVSTDTVFRAARGLLRAVTDWWESCAFAEVLAATMLAGGTRASRTCRRTQRVAGASAGGSTRARCRDRTRG